MTGVICPGGKGLGGTWFISPPNSYMDRKHEVPGSKGGFTDIQITHLTTHTHEIRMF